MKSQDFGDPALSSSVMATVQVTPLAPTFLQPVYTAEIDEFTSQVSGKWHNNRVKIIECTYDKCPMNTVLGKEC